MSRLKLMTVGLAMGIAEVIPGVSGGTIAFITGIYEELINTIKGFDLSLITTLKKDGFKAFWAAANGNFLLPLLGGMVIGIGISIVGVTYLIEYFPEPLWALFFGLIIASSIYIGRQIQDWNPLKVALVVIGFAISFYITMISPSTGSDSLIYVFISGSIAICALILPGISGSFILLLMGMYFVIIPALKSLLSDPSMDALIIVVVFALGCLTGLIAFSRVLSWTFKNYKNETLAILTGFIVGSLNKIWPWRIVNEIVIKETEAHIYYPETADLLPSLAKDDYKLLSEFNVLPQNYDVADSKIVLVAIAFVLGMGIVLLLSKIDKENA